VDPLQSLTFNKAALTNQGERVVLGIDTEKEEYGFIDEIKAPKLTA
jgi:hypothetical protein